MMDERMETCAKFLRGKVLADIGTDHAYLPAELAKAGKIPRAIASDIVEGKEGAVANYKKFLSAGGSMDPLDILKLAGVDLTKKEPFDKALKLFKDTLDELIALQ